MNAEVNPIDSFNLRQIILDTPDQFLSGISAAGNTSAQGIFDSLIVAGMGGSAMPGYLLQTAVQTRIPVFVYCNYGLPPQATKNPLIFASSYSGNTEETLDAYAESRKSMLGTVGFTNGGELLEECKHDHVPCVTYNINDPNFQPRYATPFAFAAMATVSQNSGIAAEGTVAELENTASFLKEFGGKKIEQAGREIAERIKGKIPIFYTSYPLRYAAMINKIKINEDAKLPAFWNFYPELNHNEMNGFVHGNPEQFVIVSLEDTEGHPQKFKRMRITNEILTEMKYEIISIEVKGSNTLERIFYALNWGSWIAYYLALAIGQDPTPVEMVEKLKKRLKEAE